MIGGEHRENATQNTNWNVGNGKLDDPGRSYVVLILCYNKIR